MALSSGMEAVKPGKTSLQARTDHFEDIFKPPNCFQSFPCQDIPRRGLHANNQPRKQPLLRPAPASMPGLYLSFPKLFFVFSAHLGSLIVPLNSVSHSHHKAAKSSPSATTIT